MQKRLVSLALLAGLVLGACVPSTPSPSPTVPALAATQTLAPGLLVSATGESSFVSDLLRRDSETTIRVEWEQSSQGLFAIWIIYESEEDLPDPDMYRILVENTVSPSSGAKTYTLPAGEWTVQVEEAHGPWKVDVWLIQ